MKFSREQTQRLILVSIGLVQGFIFWVTYEFWPEDPQIEALLAALISFVSVRGLIYQFAWTGRDKVRQFVVGGILSAFFALVTLWVWWQRPGEGALFQGDSFRLPTLAVASLLSLYILLPFIQIFQESGRPIFPYSELFCHSWNNFFIAAIGFLFAGLFWGLISLWVALFNLVGISFFEDVFYSAPFVSISLSAMFGFGIALGKENGAIINTLRRITLAIFQSLLPLLAFVGLLFLAALPFTGLQPLWDTKSASPLLLSVLLLTMLFINSVFQDGTGPRPYPDWVRRGVEGLLLVMPIFSGLTFYAIGLRIAQYGLTPDRFYVVLFAVVTGLYGLGYAVSAIKQSTVWMALMRPVNIGMSLLIAIIALLAHTPVLDPLGWSARNQYRRLVQEKVDAEAFDYGSMRFHLGRAGYARLLTLGQLADHPQAEIIHKQVEMVREAKSYSAWEKTRSPVITADHLNVFTPSGHLPEGLVEKLTFDLYGYLIKGCMEKKDCVVFSINLDMDQDSEYAFVTSGKWYAILLYDRDENLQWQRVGNFRFKGGKRPNRAAFIEAIEQSKTIVMQPRYGDLQIANWVLYLGQE